eukprot:TRINITY_DN2936_c0_g1_i2.p1 TRINITY_DN2936_c0_g1~~TRINITY_DN2936_c0_g1_i2.p1  ORF type:complete len:187 (-),score=22.20 TRINITY_DN2936_c0_g1_i2:23-583(-)
MRPTGSRFEFQHSTNSARTRTETRGRSILPTLPSQAKLNHAISRNRAIELEANRRVQALEAYASQLLHRCRQTEQAYLKMEREHREEKIATTNEIRQPENRKMPAPEKSSRPAIVSAVSTRQYSSPLFDSTRSRIESALQRSPNHTGTPPVAGPSVETVAADSSAPLSVLRSAYATDKEDFWGFHL